MRSKAMAAVGRHDDALEIYAEALQIHQAAVATMKSRHAAGRANRTDVLVAQEKVAETMQCMGGVQESCGNLDEAMLIYVSTLMLRRQNVSLSEDHSADGVETAMSMSGIGSVHLRKGEFNDASTVLEESLRIFKNNGTFWKAFVDTPFQYWLQFPRMLMSELVFSSNLFLLVF